MTQIIYLRPLPRGQNRVAGRVRWRAGSGDWQGGEEGLVVGALEGGGSSE